MFLEKGVGGSVSTCTFKKKANLSLLTDLLQWISVNCIQSPDDCTTDWSYNRGKAERFLLNFDFFLCICGRSILFLRSASSNGKNIRL